MDTYSSLKELAGQDLSNFKVVEMTEVFKVDDDGRKSRSIGYFKNLDVAKAFAGNQSDKHWHKTESRVVLTNGEVGFVIQNTEPIKLFDDEEETLRLKQAAIAKLDPAERRLLGYE